MLRTVAQRYRLDPRLEAVYVRPLAKAPPLLQQTADGDMASRKLSGPLSNAVYLIPESDAALTLRVQCMRWCHTNLAGGGHHGVHATYGKCRERYHWVNMNDDVRNFCAACLSCKLAKTPTTSRLGLLQSFERLLPNDTIALDILTFKSKSSRGKHGEQHILVMYDIFSHYLVARALAEEQIARGYLR